MEIICNFLLIYLINSVYNLQLSEILTMQRPIEQIYSTDEDIQCYKCGNKSGTFVSLSCEHKYCIICLTFMYVKHRKSDPNEGTVKCRCETITTLHPSHIQIVTKTLKEQVIPSIQGDNQLTIPKGIYGLQNTQTVNRKIKSEQHSFQHNITPSTTKGFFSKCQSPSSRKKPISKVNCHVHRNQLITHLCFTCEMQPLCIKCTSSSKKHFHHQVKDIQKGISIITEQTSLAKMQIAEKIQKVEVLQRRFEDRSVIIKDRASKILSDIRGCFQNLFAKLEEKQDEIITQCQQNFEEILEANNNQIQTIGENLQNLRNFHDKILSLQKDSQNFQFVLKWSQLKNQYMNFKPLNLQIDLDTKARFPSNSIFRSIDHLANQIYRVSVIFKNSSLSRVGTSQLENCRSQSKLKKEQNKRIKTNFVSLNSSRQKKKKYTKTEEDQKRLRTQKAVMIDRDKRNNKMPAYITDFINKKAQKYGVQGNSCALEITSPNIQNSKLTSKLSKTISPQQINRKKKDNMALIKQRMQRKTTQPTIKNKMESSKKKKIH